jgi:hypothetical protein
MRARTKLVRHGPGKLTVERIVAVHRCAVGTRGLQPVAVDPYTCRVAAVALGVRSCLVRSPSEAEVRSLSEAEVRSPSEAERELAEGSSQPFVSKGARSRCHSAPRRKFCANAWLAVPPFGPNADT